MAQKFPSANSTKKQPSSKSSSDNWSIAIYKILSLKKTRFGNGIMYFVGNIDPNSKYKGSKTGLDRTQIQRLDPDTVLSSKRNIVEEEKFLNTEQEDEDSNQDDDEEEQPAPVITKKTNTNDFTAKWWTNELKGVQFRDEGENWQITKVTSSGGWKVNHFNTTTKAKHEETFREVLEIGLKENQSWFKPIYKDFMIKKGWLT